MLVNIEKKDCEGKRPALGKTNTQAEEVFLTNKNNHNNHIYTMFPFYFFFGYKEETKRFGTLRNLFPCRQSCELGRLSP